MPPAPRSAEMVAAFAAAAAAAGATATRCATTDGLRAQLARHVETAAPARTRVAWAPRALLPLLPTGIQHASTGDRPAWIDLCVSVARWGVLETGGVVLVPADADERLMAVLARVHVVLLDPAAILESLDELAPLLDGERASYVTHVCGPTRTADIERVITVGAHGPREVHILMTTAHRG